MNVAMLKHIIPILEPLVLVYDPFIAPDNTVMLGRVPPVSVSGGGYWRLFQAAPNPPFVIESEKAVLQPTSGSSVGMLITCDRSNVQVSARLTTPNAYASLCGLHIRTTNTSNRWNARLTTNTSAGAGTGTLAIVEITSNVGSTRATVTLDVQLDATYLLTFWAVGNVIGCHLDHGTPITYTSTVRNTTKGHGFWITGASLSVRAKADEFKVVAR